MCKAIVYTGILRAARWTVKARGERIHPLHSALSCVYIFHVWYSRQ